MNVPKISVIIPVYNAEKHFEKCLHSLFLQTMIDIEYIFINDCTPDCSMELLQRVLNKYPLRVNSIRIIENKRNLGSGASRGKGMQAATGEYVIHCDSDDWIDLDMMQKLYEKAKKYDADIVYCDFFYEYDDYRKLCSFGGEVDMHNSLLELKCCDTLFSSLWNKLVRRSLYVDHHIYPFQGVNMWEDLGIITRLRYYCKTSCYVPEPFYHYNKLNVSSIVKNLNNIKIEEQMQCASCLENFLRDKGLKYKLLSQYILFMSKSSFLYSKQVRDLYRWRNTFSSSNHFITRYDVLPFMMRLEFLLATIPCFTWLVALFIDLKVWMSEYFKG